VFRHYFASFFFVFHPISATGASKPRPARRGLLRYFKTLLASRRATVKFSLVSLNSPNSAFKRRNFPNIPAKKRKKIDKKEKTAVIRDFFLENAKI